MDSSIKFQIDQLKQLHSEDNNGAKYLERLKKSDDHFEKVDALLDNFFKASYCLTKILTNSSSDNQTRPNGDESMEVDIDATQGKQAEQKIEGLGLPFVPDISGDTLNYFMLNSGHFLGFIALVKKASRSYLAQHDMVKDGNKAQKKHAATRVLANLVQLLFFARSATLDDVKGIESTGAALLLDFHKYFNLASDSLSDEQSFLHLYPQAAASLSVVLILRDYRPQDHPSFESYYEIISETQNTSLHEQYSQSIHQRIKSLELLEQKSPFEAGYFEKVIDSEFEDFKSLLFQSIAAHTTQILNRIQEEEWFHGCLFENNATKLQKIRTRNKEKLKEAFDKAESYLLEKYTNRIKDLRNELQSSLEEIRIIKENTRIKTEENITLDNNLRRVLEKSKRVLTVEDLNGDSLKKIRSTYSRLAIKREYAKITAAEEEIEKLQELIYNNRILRDQQRGQGNNPFHDPVDNPNTNGQDPRTLALSANATSHSGYSVHNQSPPRNQSNGLSQSQNRGSNSTHSFNNGYNNRVTYQDNVRSFQPSSQHYDRYHNEPRYYRGNKYR